MVARLRRVRIQNFRSIGPNGIDIELPLLCALVGENNSGKSNIVAALNKLLGPTYPTIQSFNTDDYFRRDSSNDPYIEVEYETDGRTRVIAFGRDPEQGQFRLFIDGRWGRGEQRDECPLVFVGVNREIRE